MDLRSPLARLVIVTLALALWSGGALGRLAYLQLVRYSDYLALARRQQRHFVEISPKRADIFDRNLHELAMSIHVDSCFAVPSEIADPGLVARLVGRVLHIPAQEVKTRLARSHSFAWIKRKISPDTVARIRALNLRGIYFQQENERFYPKRDLAAAVLGYVNIDEKGLGGIEYEFNKQIRSQPGRMLILADAHSRWYDSSQRPPDNASSIVLTIDENIQYIAEKELAAAIRQTHARAGTVIVQNPSNGAILAMANWPTFNPNAPADSQPTSRMNRAIGALYEPGSVFKIITLSAAIDQGIVHPTDLINCQMGAISIDGVRIRDHQRFGVITVSQILQHSSDVGAIKIGLRLGAPTFYRYIRAFGFGGPTGIDLPGESPGMVRPLDDWLPISVGYIAMGQGIGVTPVQMITAVSAIANGGLLYRPHVVLALRHDGQQTPLPQLPPRRVVGATTAATMRSMLEGVVLGGTGRRAQLDGYTAGGKTGTAQKVDPATGRYSPTQLIASFVGFAPLDDPALTILVQLDSPVGAHEGGAVAAPVFKSVAEQVLAYLNVPHDVPVLPKTLEAKHSPPSLLAKADFDEFGSARADSAAPAALSSAALATPSTIALSPGHGIAVPNLAGKTVREVTEICMQLGVNPVLVGDGLAEEQQPAAGAVVPQGGSLTVHFGWAPPVSSVRATAGRAAHVQHAGSRR
jgi:cell division protein FtsI/penicillin-binding protein 2